MKVDKRLLELSRVIQDEMGIDMVQYQNQEVADNVVDLMLFPKYLVNWGIRPIIVCFLLFIVGFFVVDLVHVEYILYGIIGLILFLFLGIFSACVYLVWKMKGDVRGILDYSFGVMDNVVSDTHQFGKEMWKGGLRGKLSLIFQGVVHVVAIPMLSSAVKRKIPVVGGIVNFFMKKTLNIISKKIDFKEEKRGQELVVKGKEPKVIEVYSNAIQKVSGGFGKLISVVFSIVMTPFLIGWFISAGFLAGFLYLIW